MLVSLTLQFALARSIQLLYNDMITPVPATFRGYAIERFGNPHEEVKLISNLTHSPLQPSAVHVRVHNAAVNPVDHKMVQMGVTVYLPRPTPEKPLRLGLDVAGTVVEVVSAVTDLKVGDQVFGMTTLATSGAFAEYVDIEAEHVAPKPNNRSFREAAGPGIALTSYQALVAQGQLKQGDRVLILGGSSSAGLTGAQIAKAMGASFVAATTSTRNLDFIKQYGVDQAIDYTSDKWWEVLEPNSIDLIYDCGVEPTAWDEGAQQVLTKGTGRFVTIGRPATPSVSPIGATFVQFFATSRRADFLVLKELMESGKLVIPIEKRYPFEELADALTHQMTGHTRGKLILDVISA